MGISHLHTVYIHWLHLQACIRRSHIWYRPGHLPGEDMP